MSIHLNVSLSSAVIIPEVLEKITEEKSMVAIARLIITLIRQTTCYFLNADMRKFDANPGDAACQLQALKLHKLMRSDRLREEAGQLLKAVEIHSQLDQKINHRNSPKEQAKCSPREFYEREIAPLKVSEDMLYLIRARLLTITKVPDRIESNGILVTKTNPGQLAILSKNIARHIGGVLLNHLVAFYASELSLHSIRVIQAVAASTEYAEMLSDSTIHQSQNSHGYAPKYFSCLFAQMLALLNDLKQQGAIIAIKSVPKKGEEPSHYFLKAKASGFAFLEEKEIKALDSELPLIVFEGVIADEATFRQNVEKIGFENMVLTCTAQEAPFGPQSTLADVKNATSRSKIEQYQKKAVEWGLDKKSPFFLLDHVFCVVRKHEKIKGE